MFQNSYIVSKPGRLPYLWALEVSRSLIDYFRCTSLSISYLAIHWIHSKAYYTKWNECIFNFNAFIWVVLVNFIFSLVILACREATWFDLLKFWTLWIFCWFSKTYLCSDNADQFPFLAIDSTIHPLLWSHFYLIFRLNFPLSFNIVPFIGAFLSPTATNLFFKSVSRFTSSPHLCLLQFLFWFSIHANVANSMRWCTYL